MIVTYVPVFTGLLERDIEGMHLQWWKSDAIIKHSTLLITAASGINEWDFREKHKIPTDGFTLVGDSGGFVNFMSVVLLFSVNVPSILKAS